MKQYNPSNNVDRIMGNFYKAPTFTAQVTDKELNEIVQNYSIDCIICNGKIRKLIITKLTDLYFHLKTEAT